MFTKDFEEFVKSGKNIDFAITINNYGYSNAQLMKEIEKVMNAMAGY